MNVIKTCEHCSTKSKVDEKEKICPACLDEFIKPIPTIREFRKDEHLLCPHCRGVISVIRENKLEEYENLLGSKKSKIYNSKYDYFTKDIKSKISKSNCPHYA